MTSIFDLMQTVASNVWLYGVTFLLVLSILVFVHEWGHYIVARLCGVRVETFSIGFGKELFGWTDSHGTRWKFALVPLGGYVKMFGDVDPASAGHVDGVEQTDGTLRPLTTDERKVAFFAKPVWQRALVVFAGPGINFLFAIIVLSILYMSYGKPLVPPVAMGVEIGSAADKAGFEPQDKILTAGGRPVVGFDDVRRAVMLALDTPVEFQIERAGEVKTITATPERREEEDRFGFVHEKGYLGLLGPANGLDTTQITAINDIQTGGDDAKTRALLIKNFGQKLTLTLGDGKSGQMDKDGNPVINRVIVAPPADLNAHLRDPSTDDKKTHALVLGVRPGDEMIKFNPVSAVGHAAAETWDIIKDTLFAVGQMITGTRSASELGGVIRIGALAGDMADRGMIQLISFTALLSINLGLINLFPIPMLDGGHLVFYAAEAIKGKPLSEKFQEYAFRFGLFILVSLMFFANLNDILQLIL